MASAYGKIPELNELLKQDPTLAKKRVSIREKGKQGLTGAYTHFLFFW